MATDVGPNDCLATFEDGNGVSGLVCNRPKGHDGEHRAWRGDRVMHFEKGYQGNPSIIKPPGTARF